MPARGLPIPFMSATIPISSARGTCRTWRREVAADRHL
jgi:hypothetical protein